MGVFKRRFKRNQRKRKEEMSNDAGSGMAFFVCRNGYSPEQRQQELIFRFPRKPSAAARRRRNIMPQISIAPLQRKSILFVVNMENMFSRKDHIQISIVSVCTILLCHQNCVCHLPDCSSCFIPAYYMADYLTRLSTYHGYYIDVFPCFRPWLILQKPIQFILLCGPEQSPVG